MTKELMIKAIYEKIADKTLSFGCKIQVDYNKGIFLKQTENGKIQYWNESYLCYSDDEVDNPIISIIGHSVMIGDVLDYITNDDYFEIVKDIELELLDIWEHKRKPLEEQSEECIEYIYNLIK